MDDVTCAFATLADPFLIEGGACTPMAGICRKRVGGKKDHNEFSEMLTNPYPYWLLQLRVLDTSHWEI